MKNIARYVLLLLVTVLLLAAGCTQPTPTPQVTPTPTPTPLPPMTTVGPIGMGTPGPTQTLPPQYDLAFQITANGNTANPITYVAIMGGQGMNLDPQVDVTLTKPDGSSETQVMKQPFSMGQKVQFSCSQYQNRIEIWVTAPQVGKIKTYDEIVPFQSINP